jgi:acyl-lipid omega-6 desaturase (Delta-12 desaturase)
VLRDYPELRSVSRVTLLESVRCVRLVLWDETKRCLVTFSEVKDSG